MKDGYKNKKQLIEELEKLRQRNTELETLEVKHKQEGEDLLKKLEQFRSLVESTSDFIWEVDQNSIYTYISPKIRELLGYEPEEIVGKTPFDSMLPDEAEQISTIFKAITKARDPIERLENVNLHKDGQQVVLETSGVPIVDADGNYLGYRGIDRDITERKRMEEALESERDKIRALMDGIDRAEIGIDIVDTDYKIQFQNNTLKEKFGELSGKICYESYRGLEKPCDFCPVVKSIENNTVERVELTGADGRFYELFSAPLKDADGTVDKAIEIVQDITQRKQVEDELRKTKDHLDNIIESSLDSIVVTNNQGCITGVNKSLLKLLGYSEEEVIGQLITELAPKKVGTYESTTGELAEIGKEYFDDAKEMAYNQLLEKGKILNWETYLLRKDGIVSPIEQSIVALYNEDGDITGAVGIIRDITERKKKEKEIKEARDFLENIFKTSADGIIVTDNEGVITMANEAVTRIMGYPRNELIGKRTGIFMPKGEAYRVAIKKYMTKLFEEGSVFAYDVIYLKKDGSLIDVELSAAFLKDNEDNITGSVSTIRDITERKRFERTLKMSEEKYRSLIENANDAIISLDEEFLILDFNKKAEEMLGYSRDAALGKSIFILLSLSEKEKAIRQIEAFKKTHELRIAGTTIEREFLRKDGTTFLAECSIFAFELQKKYVFTAFIRDITERREMERKLLQSEKLNSLGELAGGVAHDFNNVLAAILGRAQLLKVIVDSLPGAEEERKSKIELREGLEIIEKASKDGAETVRRIQEFARSRDDDKHFTTVDLNEIIDNAVEFTRTKWKDDAESKGIKINIKKELSTLLTTSGSAAELREVFTNLINNAVDAMPQGGRIKIKTFKEDSQIVIKVEDTGVGIPEYIRDRIFDPFFTTKGIQSTGLGMSVSYGIINRHRGTILVDSVEGEGTTFTIKLPISEKTVEAEQAKPITAEPKKAKILVIEDEEDVRNLLYAILTKGGHEVEIATSGNKGIEIFEKKEFDLVFTDLGMPGMSGWQVAERIKDINGRVPVALITGWKIELKESEKRESGVDLIVCKPFEVNQVLRLVQEGMVLRDQFNTA